MFTDRPFDIALDNVAEVTKLCKIVKRGGWVVSNVQGFTGQMLEEGTGNKVNFLLRCEGAQWVGRAAVRVGETAVLLGCLKLL